MFENSCLDKPCRIYACLCVFSHPSHLSPEHDLSVETILIIECVRDDYHGSSVVIKTSKQSQKQSRTARNRIKQVLKCSAMNSNLPSQQNGQWSAASPSKVGDSSTFPSSSMTGTTPTSTLPATLTRSPDPTPAASAPSDVLAPAATPSYPAAQAHPMDPHFQAPSTTQTPETVPTTPTSQGAAVPSSSPSNLCQSTSSNTQTNPLLETSCGGKKIFSFVPLCNRDRKFEFNFNNF